MRFNEGDNWDLRFTIKDRRVFELYLTYRIRRSFCPRKIPLVSKIEATRNFAIELGIFQSWQKFRRGTNFAWQNSEAIVPNRLILVIFFPHA